MKIKDLLKVLLFTLIIGVIIIFFGCSNTKKTSVVISTAKVDSLKPWEQSMRENIKISDSVFFYNSIEIQIKKTLDEEYNYVQDGIIYSVDFNKIEKSIPALVFLYTVEMTKKRGSNIIDAMVVSSVKDSVEYILNFYRKETQQPEYGMVNGQKTKITPLYPKTFILSGNAQIRYKGKLHNIDVSSIGLCYLFVDYRRITEDVESTEEWQQYQFIP